MIYQRLLVVFLLGFSSGLPFALLSGTLQAWFSDAGLSVFEIGSLSLLGLPYAYKFLFAPIVDRFVFKRLGRRRGWLIFSQAVLMLGLNLLVFWDPLSHLFLLSLFAFLLSFFSAIQDITVDAQRIEYLPVSDHALGASLSVLGYRLALLVGGGFSLILAHYYGFVWTYRIMSLGLIPGFISAWFSAEPTLPEEASAKLSYQDWVLPIREWMHRPYWLSCLMFILFYKLGEAFTTTTSGIVIPFLLQGMHFSLETVGYVNKGFGVLALLLGGLTAGIWLRKKSLYRALYYFGLLQAFSNFLFLLLAMTGKNLVFLCVVVGVDNWVAGMGSTALVALLMRLVNRNYTATQFSLLIAVSLLPRIFSGPIAGLLQSYVGWTGLYLIAFILSFLFIPFWLQMVRSLEKVS